MKKLLGIDACNATPLFVLNFQYSTIGYEIQGLKHAQDLGLPVKFLEIGNEHNLPPIGGTDQFRNRKQ